MGLCGIYNSFVVLFRLYLINQWLTQLPVSWVDIWTECSTYLTKRIKAQTLQFFFSSVSREHFCWYFFSVSWFTKVRFSLFVLFWIETSVFHKDQIVYGNCNDYHQQLPVTFSWIGKKWEPDKDLTLSHTGVTMISVSVTYITTIIFIP